MNIFAPGPAPEQRRGLFVRMLQGLGLSALNIALVVVVAGAYLASQWMAATPQQLYHRIWQAAPNFIYDPGQMKDWDKWQHKFDSEIKTDEDAVKFANEMLDSLKDPFTRMHSRAEVQAIQQEMSGKFAGVGITLGYKSEPDGKPILGADKQPLAETDDGGYPIIDSIIEGGPAEKAGLKGGDAMVSANGVSLKDATLKQVIEQLKGKENTTVKLRVRSKGVERDVDIVRGIVSVPVVSTKEFGDIGYVRLNNFEQEDTLDEMFAALTKLKNSKGLIIDLRGNPGGRVDICINLAAMFLEQGDIVSIRNRVPFGGHSKTTYHVDSGAMTVTDVDEDSGETSQKLSRRPANMAQGKEIVILVDGHSASASEMFTGALKDNNRAVVVGEKTFGKGIGQMMLPMPNGTVLRVTTLRYFTPNGTWLGDGSSAHDGIEPHHKVEAPKTRFKATQSGDTQFEFALELLKKKISGK